MPDPQTRHTRGLIVVIVLGVIFFTLLGLIILKSGEKRPEGPAINETLTVLPMRIRVRTEANARAPVVATVNGGQQVLMLEDQGAWVRVRTAGGLEGWAERANLERTIEQERRLARFAAIRKLPPLEGNANDRTQLFAGPGIFYPLVGELPDGKKVVVYTRDHDFYAIDHEGQVAYAPIDTIDVTAPSEHQLDVQTASAAPAPTTTTPTTTQIAETATTPPEPEPPVVPEPEPTPEPRPEPVDTGRVFAAVPAGGTQPTEANRVVPRYPSRARAAGVQGAVVIRGIVRRDGTIDNVEVIKDLPYGLGEAARDAVTRWRFHPATYRGEPIDVYYTVTVNFRLR
ncbi:MAG TPA: TonB family protein [Thermoanaerobaculia bacterium]|jgi:TonB family protein